jgi:hypothetical protein
VSVADAIRHARHENRLWRGIVVLPGLAVIWYALAYAVGNNRPWIELAVFAASLAGFAWVAWWLDPEGGFVARSASPTGDAKRPNTRVPLWLLPPGALATIIAANRVLDAGRGPVGWNVAIPWLLGIGLCLAAALWPVVASMSLPQPSVRALLPWIGMILVAALPRLLWLDRFPSILDSDEASLMLVARESQADQLLNPFGTGWFGNPNLYPVIEGWVASWLDDGVAAHRTLSAVMGTVGVLATWRFGRYLLGPSAAIGAIILATMPLHLHLSRSGLNNIVDPTALVLALLFLLRAIRNGRAVDGFLAGVALGLGGYGYFGGRAFPGVIAVLLVIAATDRRLGIRAAIGLGAWIVCGFLATTAPLLMAFVNNPAELSGHMAMVSPLSWELVREDPAGQLRIYGTNLRDALLYPWAGNNQGFFRHEPPYFGWPLAILLEVGCAVWLASAVRMRSARPLAWLLVPWLLLVAGIGTTIPISGQRYLAIAPILALAAGSGIVLLARWMSGALPSATSRLRLSVLLAATATALLVTTELRWYASEDRQLVAYGDTRTLLAWDIGWRLSQPDTASSGEPVVLFAGAPAMFAKGFANWRFLAPDVPVTDIETPIARGNDLPRLEPGTILILIDERADERCAAEQAYTGATVAEVRARHGPLLYIAFFYGDPPGWSTATTPAGSTYTEVAPSTTC